MKTTTTIFVLAMLLHVGCAGNNKKKTISPGAQNSAVTKSQTIDTDAADDNLHRLIELMQIEKHAQLNIDRAIESMKQAAPGIPAEFWRRFKEQADTSAYVEMALEVYPKYLTESEIGGIVAFYESEVGRKMLRFQETITAETFAVSQQWGKQLALRVQAKLRNEAIAEASPVPPDHSPFAKKIREMFLLSGMEAFAQTVFDQMMENMKQVRPDISDDFWEGFRREIDMDELLDLSVPIIKKYYSESDVQYMVAFYGSEAGKKLATVQPQMASDMMTRGQEWGAKLGEKIEREMQEEMKNADPSETAEQ